MQSTHEYPSRTHPIYFMGGATICIFSLSLSDFLCVYVCVSLSLSIFILFLSLTELAKQRTVESHFNVYGSPITSTQSFGVV